MIDKLNNYYSKERKYSKMSKESIKESRRNASGNTKFAEEYKIMHWKKRKKNESK